MFLDKSEYLKTRDQIYVFTTLFLFDEGFLKKEKSACNSFVKLITDMAPMFRCSGVGPLFVRTGSSSSSNEQSSTPRAARCKTMHRRECAKPLISKGETFTRVPSVTRVFSRVSSNTPEPGWAFSRAFHRVSSTTPEPTGRQVHKGIDPTLAFERVSSYLFERGASVQSQRLQRGTSITTDATDMPSMIHRTSSTDMLANFQTLKVQGASSSMSPCPSSLSCSLSIA